MKNVDAYLGHISEAINKILEYSLNVEYKDFKDNSILQDAIIRQFAIIGEAANNIDGPYRESHPEIPWRKMTDLRNVLIHEYFGVNMDIVWKTIQDDLPELEKQISDLLEADN